MGCAAAHANELTQGATRSGRGARGGLVTGPVTGLDGAGSQRRSAAVGVVTVSAALPVTTLATELACGWPSPNIVRCAMHPLQVLRQQDDHSGCVSSRA